MVISSLKSRLQPIGGLLLPMMSVDPSLTPACSCGVWQNPKQIRLKIRKRRTWIASRLAKWNNIATLRCIRGRPTRFFPPCVLMTLRIEAYFEIRPAGGWKTRNEIIKLLGKDLTWRTMDKLLAPYIDLAEIRLDKRNRARIHYPPKVFNNLWKQIPSN